VDPVIEEIKLIPTIGISLLNKFYKLHFSMFRGMTNPSQLDERKRDQ